MSDNALYLINISVSDTAREREGENMEGPAAKKHLEGQLPADAEDRLWKAYDTYCAKERSNGNIPDNHIRWMRNQYGIKDIYDTVEQGKHIDPQKGYLYFKFDDDDAEKAQEFLKIYG
jgi:hypothetical protein